jgi:hypothetical protein
MNIRHPDKLKALEILVEDICGQHDRLEQLTHQFRQRIEQVGSASESSSSPESGAHWKLIAFVDSLVRVRLFLENNFKCVETIGILAVARYMFELTVWLKLLQRDSRYGVVYHRELLKKQLEFYAEFRNNAVREISFLRVIGVEEQRLIESRLSETKRLPDEEARKKGLRELSQRVTQEIDRKASRIFSLYAEQAQSNGYDFQAHLVETKVLPEYSKAIADLKQKLDAFERNTPSDVRCLVPKRWNWRDQAERVDMKDEYDFIYAYASRLLHATPASLTTNQKSLEPDEMRAFLKYIRVRLLDIIEMAEALLASNSTRTN